MVRCLALEAGFAEAGLVALPHGNESRDADRFEQFVSAGRTGSMHYLERTNEQGKLLRARAATPFPWARSAIVCFANYHCAQPRSTNPAAADAGWIARYAWSGRPETSGEKASRAKSGCSDAEPRLRPSDYHKVLRKRLNTLEARLRDHVAEQPGQSGDFEARGYVDTGPVVERALATAAGLGWTGKNTCLIHPKLGSYGFLAVLLTSIEVQAEMATLQVAGGCGSCRRCIDACPTGALDTPYQMDATRCISYLTIEHCGPIDAELMNGMGRQLFGCDICQDVCPWNRKAPISADPELQPRPELVNPSLDWLAALAEADWEHWFNGSPVRRAGYIGLRRNLAIAMGNSGLQRFIPWLEKLGLVGLERTPGLAEEGLRSAAQWALNKLRERSIL
jgi:epoxyqueuosine reductase